MKVEGRHLHLREPSFLLPALSVCVRKEMLRLADLRSAPISESNLRSLRLMVCEKGVYVLSLQINKRCQIRA